MPASHLLFFRLAKFLRAHRGALVTDCSGALGLDTPAPAPPDEDSAPAPVLAPSGFPWREQLDWLVEAVAGQLTAEAAGEGLAPSRPGAHDDGVQGLLLQTSLVRTAFLRVLNRFQSAADAESHGHTFAEMTEARQHALGAFDQLSTAALSDWIAQAHPAAADGADPRRSPAAAQAPAQRTPEPPAPAPAATAAPPAPPLHPGASLYPDLRDGVHAALALVEQVRDALPPERQATVRAALRQIERLGGLVETLAGPADDAAPEPAGSAAVAAAGAPTVTFTSRPLPFPPAPPAPARPASAQMPPVRREALRVAPLDVRSFAQALTETFRPLAEQKGLRFEMTCDPALGGIQTDAPKLHRAASLLLSNAVTYSARGRVHLELRSAERPGAWTLAVHDTGPGIARDRLEALLCPSDRATGDGTALGISAARALAGMLGGSLQAESQPGYGSHFHLTLPRQPG